MAYGPPNTLDRNQVDRGSKKKAAPKTVTFPPFVLKVTGPKNQKDICLETADKLRIIYQSKNFAYKVKQAFSQCM